MRRKKVKRMDDQIFEQRLSNLKKSYEQLPAHSSSEKIIERIKIEEKKKRNFFFISVFICSKLYWCLNHCRFARHSAFNAKPVWKWRDR